MFPSYDGSLQLGLVNAGPIVPVAGHVGSWDPDPSSSLNIQRRHLPKRLTFGAMDRLIFAGLYRLVPSILNALTIVKPETVVRWHRAGFRSYWCWKSRPRGGRTIVPPEIRQLIREMSIANPLWGARQHL
jgi:hypothetical protein